MRIARRRSQPLPSARRSALQRARRRRCARGAVLPGARRSRGRRLRQLRERDLGRRHGGGGCRLRANRARALPLDARRAVCRASASSRRRTPTCRRPVSRATGRSSSVARATRPIAGRRRAWSAWVVLPPVVAGEESVISSAEGVSGDGSVAVGWNYFNGPCYSGEFGPVCDARSGGFQWSQAGGMLAVPRAVGVTARRVGLGRR